MSKVTKIKCLTLAALALGVAPTALYALGLGNLDLQSRLNEPLNGQIELTHLGDLEPEEIVAKIASQETYEKAGLEKPAVLRRVKFNVDTSSDQKPILQIESHDPVQDPFLDVLIEVTWPQGRVIRNYTLLLDLPEQAKGKKKSATKLSHHQTKSIAISSNADVTVTENQTLWRIARNLLPVGTNSVPQMVMALAVKNPHAFSQNDINRLVIGAKLRIPTSKELQSISVAQAEQFLATPHVLAQNHTQVLDTFASLQEEPSPPRETQQLAQAEIKLPQENGFEGREVIERPLTLRSAQMTTNVNEPLGTVSAINDSNLAVLTQRLSGIEQSMSQIKDSYRTVNDRIVALEEQNAQIIALVQNGPNTERKDDNQYAQAQNELDESLALTDPSVDSLPNLQLENTSLEDFKRQAIKELDLEGVLEKNKSQNNVSTAQTQKVDGTLKNANTTVISDIVDAVASPLNTTPSPSSKPTPYWLYALIIAGLGAASGFMLLRRRELNLNMLSKLDSLLYRFKGPSGENDPSEKSNDKQDVNYNLSFDIDKAIQAVTDEETRFAKNPKLAQESEKMAEQSGTFEAQFDDALDQSQTIDDAKVFIAYERFDQAEAILNNLLATNSNDWNAVLLLLELYVLSGKYSEFEQLYSTLPSDFSIHQPDIFNKMLALHEKIQNEQVDSGRVSNLLDNDDSSSANEPELNDELLTNFEELGPNQFQASTGKSSFSLEQAPTDAEKTVQSSATIDSPIELELQDNDLEPMEFDPVTETVLLTEPQNSQPEEPEPEHLSAVNMSPREVDDLLALIQAYVEIGEEVEAQALAEKVRTFGTESQKLRLNEIFNS